MTPAGRALRDRLLALRDHDLAVRARLAGDGSLFDGYNAEMQAVHDANAAELQVLIVEHGWPTAKQVGDDGAEAAWLIVQHAIAQPAFQRACLVQMRAAAETGELPPWQMAMLEDRIAVREGRLQRYGTQFDWDDDGLMSPNPIEDPAGVDARRATVGLPPLAEVTARHRAECGPETRPKDLQQRRRDMEAWERRVGWRT